MGEFHRLGQGVEQNYPRAVEWYVKAADGGYAKAMHNLGKFYFDGTGVKQDYRQSIKWFRKASDAGMALSMNNVAVQYSKGLGVPQNADEAMKWYRKAVKSRSTLAVDNMGKLHAKAQGSAREEIAQWLIGQAKANNAHVAFALAMWHNTGRYEFPTDNARTILYLQKAADLGVPQAMFNLSQMYLAGLGVDKDEQKAREWLNKAAAAGNKMALELVGPRD